MTTAEKREKIASIINPTAWDHGQAEDDRWDFERDKARRKADEIMRLEYSCETCGHIHNRTEPM